MDTGINENALGMRLKIKHFLVALKSKLEFQWESKSKKIEKKQKIKAKLNQKG